METKITQVETNGKYIFPLYIHISAVFELNSALGGQRAHFHGRAHVFQMCASIVRTYFYPIIIVIYWRSALEVCTRGAQIIKP